MPKRAIFYIDGLNLYHAIDKLGDDALKWLCVDSLARQLVPQKSERVERVTYFSAYPTHLAQNWPGKLARHRLYVKALMSTGVVFVEGNFKRKYVTCKADCRKTFFTHEEKETDVSIGLQLLEDAFDDAFDVAYIISADTDFAPALRRVKARFPNKELVNVLPPGARFARELQRLSDRRIQLKAKTLAPHLLPAKVLAADGTTITRPPVYDPAP